MSFKNKYSVVVPLYNGAGTVVQLFEEIRSFFELKGLPFEVVFVDDASIDRSYHLLEQLRNKYPGLICLHRMARNSGQQRATIKGLGLATGDWMITMDDDLEVHPAEIAKLMDKQAIEQADLVYGYFTNKKTSWWRRLGSWFYNWRLQRAVDKDISMAKGGSSFRLLKRPLYDMVLNDEAVNFNIDAELLSNSACTAYAEVEQAGNRPSRHSLKQLIQRTVGLSLATRPSSFSKR